MSITIQYVTKWFNLSSKFFHHLTTPRSQFSGTNRCYKIATGSCWQEPWKQAEYWNLRIYWAISIVWQRCDH